MSTTKVDMKVVLLGKEYGGKTSLVERFIHERFNENVPYQNTIGAAFGAKSVPVDGKSTTLGIWDTAGSERYEAMSRIYYRGAKAAIVCYDITDLSSWDRAKFWVKEIGGQEESCKVYLCGTKKDLLENGKGLRAMDYHDQVDYADLIGAKVFETSSKTGENVEELFQEIAKDFVLESTAQHYETDANKVTLGMSPDQQNQNKQCSGCSIWN